MRRRTLRRLTVATVLVAVPLTLVVLLESGRTDPRQVPQSFWHRLGTESRGHSFEMFPAQHPVAIQPVDESIVEHAMGMANGSGSVSERGGRFDQETGGITVLGPEARLEAELAVPWRPTLTNALRHEYGHALLYDWLRSLTDEESAEALLLGAATPYPNAGAFPKALEPVITEYATTRTDIYGARYYTSAFDEYLAESYSRYLAGRHVGPEAARFLRAIEEHPASVR